MASTVQRATNRGRLEHCENCEARSQRINAHLDTFRSRSRLSAPPVVAHQPVSGSDAIKGGNLFISSIRLPGTSVSPGGNVQVEVVLSNGATVIGGGDPDYCGGGLTQSPGYKYRLSVDPTWDSAKERTGCLPLGKFSVNRTTLTFEFTAPEEPGGHTLTFALEARESGETTAVQRNITVEQDGTVNPPPEDDPGGGGGGGGGGNGGGGGGAGPWLPCFVDPTRDCPPAELLGYGSILFAVIFILARS